MRDAGLTTDCGCGPVIGEIKHGFKYPFGTVTVNSSEKCLQMSITNLHDSVL